MRGVLLSSILLTFAALSPSPYASREGDVVGSPAVLESILAGGSRSIEPCGADNAEPFCLEVLNLELPLWRPKRGSETIWKARASNSHLHLSNSSWWGSSYGLGFGPPVDVPVSVAIDEEFFARYGNQASLRQDLASMVWHATQFYRAYGINFVVDDVWRWSSPNQIVGLPQLLRNAATTWNNRVLSGQSAAHFLIAFSDQSTTPPDSWGAAPPLSNPFPSVIIKYHPSIMAKVLQHEIGHTYGMAHCDPTNLGQVCIMACANIAEFGNLHEGVANAGNCGGSSIAQDHETILLANKYRW